jgi:hypothetical protein
MKTKKYGVFVVLSAALLITALIASCVDPIGSDFRAPATSAKGTAGMARIQVKIVNQNARTILPNQAVTSYSVYAHTGSTLGTAIATSANTTIPAVVTPGTYTITVLGSNATGVIVQGSEPDVVLSSGSSNSGLPITLSVIDDDGTGTFAWNITPPSNIGAGATTVALTALSGGDVTGFPKATLTGSETLDSGYYEVTVTFSLAGYQSISVPATLHVYQNMTSTYTLGYGAIALVSNLHTITLDADTNGGSTTQNTIPNIPHATVAAAPTTPTPPVGGSVFDGWYTAATAGTKWDFTAGTGTKVLGNITLFAQYTAGASFNVLVTFTGTSEATWVYGTNPIPLDKADMLPTSVALTGGNFSSVVWYLDGIPTSIGSGTPLSLNWNDLILLAPAGSYKLFVTATIDSIPYSSPLANAPTVTIGAP